MTLAIDCLFFLAGTPFKLLRAGYRLRRRTQSVPLNSLSGMQFELRVADLLRHCGYEQVRLTERFDYGIDIIAHKNGVRWGIQVKRYSDLVRAEAVRQVVTGLKKYECDRAMVITNSYYSRVARELARCNDCVLVDGVRLSVWMRKSAKKGKYRKILRPRP